MKYFESPHYRGTEDPRSIDIICQILVPLRKTVGLQRVRPPQEEVIGVDVVVVEVATTLEDFVFK